MTIKELCQLIPYEHTVKLAINGNLLEFAHKDPFHLDAFGDYEIQGVAGIGDEEIEIEIKMQPVKHIR